MCFNVLVCRESGHDTSNRLDGVCADIATVDLNSLIYKYTTDLSAVPVMQFLCARGENDSIFECFKKWISAFYGKETCSLEDWSDSSWAAGIRVYDKVDETASEKVPAGQVALYETLDQESFRVTLVTSEFFRGIAASLRSSMHRNLWNAEHGMFYDFNCRKGVQTGFESATSVYPLWSGAATQEQADIFVPNFMRLFLQRGGLSGSTLASRGEITPERPQRQWDHPFGWAPHQIIAWRGLVAYGYPDMAAECAYRWLYAIAKTFSENKGVVPEKLDVVDLVIRSDVEYGTEGSDFEGFGWMNASFLVGQQILSTRLLAFLGRMTDPADICFSRK